MLACLLALSCLLAAGSGRGAEAPVVEYLYIEANEHGASGGHVAVRVGDDAYHYQQADDRLRLERVAWVGFRFQYGVLENRRIHATRLAVDADAVERWLDSLRRRLLLESAQRDRLRDLRQQGALLDAWLETSRGGHGSFALDGAGFLDPPGDDATGSAAIAALRERVLLERGAGFLEERAEAVDAAIRALPPPSDDPIELASDRDFAALTAYPLVRRFDDLAQARHALERLREGSVLRPTARIALPDGVLNARDRARLRVRRAQLESGLAALVGSKRPDWGFPFLLGLARLAALDASLVEGRWILLDARDLDGPSLAFAELAGLRDALAPLAGRARRDSQVARARFLAAGPARESRHAALEIAASRWVALERALADGEPLRLLQRAALPRGRSSVVLGPAYPRPQWTRDVGESGLVRALVSAREREDVYAASLRRSRGYRLFTRNCVTALWESLDPLLLSSQAEPPSGGIVPFESARRIAALDIAAGTRTLPSHRDVRLAELADGASEFGWRLALREASPLTATAYRPNPRDSRFLFFTDDVFWRRPLLGTLNLAAGLLQSAAGLLWLPIDGGDALTSGLRGSFSSVPELFFFNIRKGSYPFAVPPDPGEIRRE